MTRVGWDIDISATKSLPNPINRIEHQNCMWTLTLLCFKWLPHEVTKISNLVNVLSCSETRTNGEYQPVQGHIFLQGEATTKQ